MPPKRPPTSPDRAGLPTTDHMDRLVAAVETLAGEMNAIRQILDLILDDFRWALNNDKFGPECFPKTADLVSRLAEGLDADEDDVNDGLAEADTRSVLGAQMRRTEPDAVRAGHSNAPSSEEPTHQRDLFS
jgi:hypothetical protein